MRSAQDWLTEYGQRHQHPLNKAIHIVCIPLIMISTVGLLSLVPVPGLPGAAANAGALALAFAVVYYLLLNVRLAIGMTVVALVVWAAVQWLAALPIAPLWLSATAIFVGAWAVQLWGHQVEGRKPSFFKDLQFLLIGPMWLVAAVYRALGVRF